MANGVKNRISTAVKELETLCNNLLAQPPLAVEAAVVTAVKGVDGALIRSVLDTIIFYFVSAYSTPSRAISFKPRWIDARNTGVLFGANAGITCVMKKIRGKEDSQTRMVAGFGAGVLFSMVRRDPPTIVIVSGFVFALMEEGFFKMECNPNQVYQSGVKNSGVKLSNARTICLLDCPPPSEDSLNWVCDYPEGDIRISLDD